MKANDFISCPDHLLAAAIAYGERLELRGYKVIIEKFDLAFPRTPQFVAKRNRETLIVEVMDEPVWDRIEEWAKYAKACSTETRVAIGFAKGRALSVEEMTRLGILGVGALVWDGAVPIDAVPTKDLALQAEPPALPAGLSRKLGHAYDQLDQGNWREGFEEACQVLEQEARIYLKKSVPHRVQILSKSGAVSNPTHGHIDKMTLGQLAEEFSRIRSPNLADSRIGQSLKRVNEDRISVVHYKNVSASREATLRRRFGKNMMVLINGLKLIKGIN